MVHKYKKKHTSLFRQVNSKIFFDGVVVVVVATERTEKVQPHSMHGRLTLALIIAQPSKPSGNFTTATE